MKVILLRISKILIIGIFALFSLVWLASPMVGEKIVQDHLAPLGLTLHADSHIRYNPFLSSISIDSLSITQKELPVFSLRKLYIELNLYKLLIKQLEVKTFSIQGLESSIVMQNENLTIAGIKFPADSQNKESQDENEKDKSANAFADFQLHMPVFKLSDSKLDLTINKQLIPLNLTEFSIKKFKASLTSQSMQVAIAFAVKNSALELESEIDLINNQGEVTSVIDLKDLDLALFSAYLPKNIDNLSGRLSFNGKQRLALSQDNSTIILADNQLSIAQVSVEQENVKLTVAKQNLIAKEVSLHIDQEKQINVKGNAQIEINNVAAVNRQNSQLVLFKAQQLSVNEVVISTIDNIAQVIIEQLQLEKVLLSDNSADEFPALTEFSQLTINDIFLNPSSIAVNNIALSGLKVDAQIAKDKTVSSMEALNPATAPAKAEGSTEINEVKTAHAENETTSPAFQFSLKQFSLADPANIHFLDNSVEPSYQRDFTINQLTLSDLDSQKTEQETKLLLAGSSNDYAKFELTSINKPFAELPYYSVKGFINELSLPAVSSYVKEALNHEIKSGQLNLAIDTELLGSDISGEADILLRGIDFTSANDHQVDSLKDQTAIPFSMALGMLKDSKGNVELNIPLAGDTNDPSFGVSGFFTLIIKQATMMAAKDYLMTTFVPYANVVSIAMTAGEFLLKVRFNDMIFTPGEVDMQSHHQNFLSEFSQLMRDKPETQITLCGVSTPTDINLPTGKIIEDKSAISQLTELSKQRAEHFKKIVVNEYQLDSSRLLLCAPQIDFDKDAKPRITFSS